MALLFRVSSAFTGYLSCLPAEPAQTSHELKVAIVTSNFERKQRLGEAGDCITTQQEAYARRHNYDLIVFSDCKAQWLANAAVMPPFRPELFRLTEFPHLCKEIALLVTLQTRPDIDWLFWLDDDSVITQPERRLQDFVPASPIDFILPIGAELSVQPVLPPGAWHDIFPHVPKYATTPGAFNAGIFMMRNTGIARSALWAAVSSDARSVNCPTSGLDQCLLGHMLLDVTAADEKSTRVQGDIVTFTGRHGVMTIRFVLPRCMNAHPANWSPWARWMPGDFIMHVWGRKNDNRLLDACISMVLDGNGVYYNISRTTVRALSL